MNKEVRYDDVKQKNGQVTIRLRFFVENNVDNEFGSDAYIPVYVKSLKPTKAEIKKYGTFEDDEDETGVSEFCRLNLTKWKMIGAPKEALKYVKKLIGKTLWCYYNGAECSWKFFDPDGDIDVKNAGLYIIEGEINDKNIDKLYELELGKCYEPYCDARGNYGDVNVHAVYDMHC